MKPFLRWAGSKRQLLPKIIPLIAPDYERYVEPFAGSASLFFSLLPKRALLGDINHELIFTYRQIKKQASEVGHQLGRLRKCKSVYLKLRSTPPATLKPAARAARFIFLNRCCFNGLYRTNHKGQFNVPYGGPKSGQLPTARLLNECAAALARVEFVSSDFELSLKRVRPDDFVYMDPPFSVQARRVFNEYDATIFNRPQIERLRSWMLELRQRRIKFLVSYAASNEAEYLRKGFNSKVVTVRRNIAGFAANRAASDEVLIWND